MKRLYLFLFSIFIYFTSAYAGDVSNLVNLGFSKDGNKYAFGEYGLTDKNFRAYADIYIIDVEKNDFVKKGIFHTSPTKATENKESKSIFLALQNRAAPYLSKNGISEKRLGRPLYVQTERTKNSNTLFFRDFETSNDYTVNLHTEKKGLSASFYITMTLTYPDGTQINKKIGNPNYQRKDVVGYAIKKIIINDNNSSLVFILEKIIHDISGDSVRYMVETIKI